VENQSLESKQRTRAFWVLGHVQFEFGARIRDKGSCFHLFSFMINAL